MIDAPTAQFGPFYFTLIAASAIIALVLRRLLTRPAGAGISFPKLDAYQLAYLAGGAERVNDAALAALAQRDAIRAEPSTREISRVQKPRILEDATALVVWDALVDGPVRRR